MAIAFMGFLIFYCWTTFHLDAAVVQVSSKLDLKDEKHELDQSLDVDLDRVGGTAKTREPSTRLFLAVQPSTVYW